MRGCVQALLPANSCFCCARPVELAVQLRFIDVRFIYKYRLEPPALYNLRLPFAQKLLTAQELPHLAMPAISVEIEGAAG